MRRQIIHTTVLPPAIGPYSAAVRAGDFIFLSGQIPYNLEKKAIVNNDITEETSIVLNNIQNFLKQEKLSFKDIVKTTIFLTDINEFEKVNTIYNNYFHESLPARSCIEVSRLPKNVHIEIECVIYAPFS